MQLEDNRTVAALTTASNNPSVIGEDLAHLLVSNPALDLATIRLIPNDDGTVGIAGRVGPLAEPECPSCHTHAGHPHTEYCQLVDFASQLTHLELNGPMTRQHYAPPCSAPAADRGDGRGCEMDDCPRHGRPNEDPCPKCLGDKQVANTDDAEPWSCWAKLPPGADLAVRMGLVQPITCPECKGTGTTA